MVVYILCVDGSSGVEDSFFHERVSERESVSVMRSERETPNGHMGNCYMIFGLIISCWGTANG